MDRRFRFTYTNDSEWCLNKDKNNILIMMRQFIKPDKVDLTLMKKLRMKYERIAFFHDDAGGGIPRLEVLPLVDLFYSKALFRDKNLYTRQLYGKELYSNYYHEKYGVTDSEVHERAIVQNSVDLGKLRLSWNIGIGDYPRGKFRQRSGVAFARLFGTTVCKPFYLNTPFPENPVEQNRELYPVHARIGLINRPSISYQRKLILEKIQDDERFLTGAVSQKQFNYETAHSRIVLSPFGWGELCLRDFETIRGGALLLKPDMSHLETWPDVFLPYKTYVPFSWDVDDLIEKAAYYLENREECRKIAQNAVCEYRNQSGELQKRFSNIMEEICL